MVKPLSANKNNRQYQSRKFEMTYKRDLTLLVHSRVNSSDQPVEDSVVNALRQGIATSNGLNFVQRHLVGGTTLSTVLSLDGSFFEHVLQERRRNFEKSSGLIQSYTSEELAYWL